MRKMTEINSKIDIMKEVAKFYRIEARKIGAEFKGVIIHKASGKEMIVDIPATTDHAAIAIARSQLVAAVKNGTLRDKPKGWKVIKSIGYQGE